MASHPDADRGSTRAVPAWSLPAGEETPLARRDWPDEVTRSWAIDGSTGHGVSVCIVDSGVDADHPRVGKLDRAVWFAPDAEGDATPQEDHEGDLCGHGTACAGIVRALAPGCRITSARVLGSGLTGSGPALLAGLRWAVEQRFDLVNMSLSTTKHAFASAMRELVDDAYFRGTTIVASAHNLPVESYPWRFASVISVGTHEEDDPYALYYNPKPPVEFFARGVDVEVPWTGGGMLRVTGNSFATPHVTGLAALTLAKHPGLTPFELKTVLYLIATNVGGRR
jgi:subtilisin family serine protease